MPTTLTAQNGVVVSQSTKIAVTGCAEDREGVDARAEACPGVEGLSSGSQQGEAGQVREGGAPEIRAGQSEEDVDPLRPERLRRMRRGREWAGRRYEPADRDS